MSTHESEAERDAAIVELYFARDERAITESERAYGGYCRRIAENILRYPPDEEECVNDTWLRAWQSIPPARPAVLRLFLGRITRNLALDRYRRTHNSHRNRDLEVTLSELENCIALPEEEAGRLPALLNEFLAGLEKQTRQMFVLRYHHGQTVASIARAAGVTENAVSVRLYKTREKLRAFLNERGYPV